MVSAGSEKKFCVFFYWSIILRNSFKRLFNKEAFKYSEESRRQ